MTDEYDALGRRFETFVLDGVHRVKARGYNPTMFLSMVAEQGAVQATKALLKTPGRTSYGFERLWELGELGTSVEFAVCLAWFRDLFTLDEQDEARHRLELHQFPVLERLQAAEVHPPNWYTKGGAEGSRPPTTG